MSGILRTAGNALAPWLQIVPLESTIVDRARSAFLVHWFGPRIPVDGLSLKGIIVNIGELSAQRQLAERSLPQTATGPNLFEPVAGIAGLAAGILITPMGAIVGAVTMIQIMGLSVKTFFIALLWVAAAIGFLIGMIAAPAGTAVLVGGAIAGLVGGAALIVALSDRNDVRAVYNLFAALAGMMNATVIFLREIMGGAAQAKNPLMRQFLGLFQPLAAMMAQLIGAVAIFVRRIGPVLPSVALMLISLGALIRDSFAALSEIGRGLMDRIDQLRNGPLSLSAVVKRVITVAQTQVAKVQEAFKSQLEIIIAELGSIQSRLASAFTSFIAEVTAFVEYLWKSHPVVETINAFRSQIDIISQAFKSAPPPPPGPSKPGFFDPLIKTLPKLPDAPTFPALPTVPDREKIKEALGLKDVSLVPPLNFDAIEATAKSLGSMRAPLVLSEDARREVEKAMRRPSIFEPERRRFETELGMTPEAALGQNAQQMEKFRDAFAIVAGRILPPEMRAVYAPMLAETFITLDKELYGIDREKTELPVLDLPTNDDLRPIVKLLRFRIPSSDEYAVRSFQDRLIDRMKATTYKVRGGGAPAVMPAPVPVGAP